MASTAALIVRDDGSFEATPELRASLHLKPGTRLELVKQSESEVQFRIPRHRDIKSWRDLEGILTDSEHDPNAELEAERIRELNRF